MFACCYLPLWLCDTVECRKCSAYYFSYDPRIKFLFHSTLKLYNEVKMNRVGALHPESTLGKHTATTNYPQSHSNLQWNKNKQPRHSAYDCSTMLSTASNIQACPSKKPVYVTPVTPTSHRVNHCSRGGKKRQTNSNISPWHDPPHREPHNPL